MRMTLKACKEDVIPQLNNPKDNATNSTMYTGNLRCKNYIVCREKLKQVLKRLSLLLLDHYSGILKAKLRIWSDFKNIEEGGRIPKLIDDIKGDGYGLRWIECPPVLYHRACLKYTNTRKESTCVT